jgi:hypothetical protein
MTTTEPLEAPPALRPPESSSVGRDDARPARSPAPTGREILDESLSLVGVTPVDGPAAVLLIGPWLLLVLMLIGPFALLFTLVVVLVAAAALVASVAAILAAPFLLVRRLRRAWAAHASMPAPARTTPLDAQSQAV